jgi:hypothetical protein
MEYTCFMSGTAIRCGQLDDAMKALGYASAICTTDGFGGCSCLATVDQLGAVGVVSFDPPTSGSYTTSANLLTLDGKTTYAYCVSGNQMTWTPQTTLPLTTGVIVFEKQ